VISDVVMPRFDGLELARSMEVMTHPPPILLMSGWALRRMELEWPLLVKPFDAHDLLAAVDRLLGAQGQDDQRSSDAAPS